MAQTTAAALAAPAVASHRCRLHRVPPPRFSQRGPAAWHSTIPAWPQTPAARGDVAPPSKRHTRGATRASIAACLWPCGIGQTRLSRQRLLAASVGAVAVACWAPWWATRSARATGAPPPRCWARWWQLCLNRDRKTHPHPDHLPGARAPGDGSSRVFTRSQPPAVGTRWCCRARASRVADGAPCRRRSSPASAPVPDGFATRLRGHAAVIALARG